MSLIDISDPNDPSVVGGLSNPDPVLWVDVLAGNPSNLTLDEFTSSADVKTLFDLTEPPSFIGPFMVWGELDAEAGSLSLFLAPSTGDRTFPFATLDGFVDPDDSAGVATGGTGALTRSNTLPPAINWSRNP
jgi:hypothetical protein